MSLRAVALFDGSSLQITALEKRIRQVVPQAQGLLVFAASTPVALVIDHRGHRQVLGLDGTTADLRELQRDHPELNTVLAQIDRLPAEPAS